MSVDHGRRASHHVCRFRAIIHRSGIMTALRHLRLVALLEGTSFLVLLFIAMPLKYLADLPLAVRIVGSVHGALFLMFIAVLYRAGSERDWPLPRWVLAFVSSIVPFGTFLFDRSLRREIAAVAPLPGVLPRLDRTSG
jgi:integral membrane protein